MTAFEIHPLDTLFFRDARPMEAGAGSGGHGANWPLPTVVHEAFRAALLRLAGELRTGKTGDGHGGRKIMTEAFRSLHTRGPFPMDQSSLYLPCPADLVNMETSLPSSVFRFPSSVPAASVYALMSPLAAGQGASDLPAFLRPVAAPGRTGKQKPPAWVTAQTFGDLLAGRIPTEALPKAELYDPESRIGVGIDDTTGAAAEKLLYSAEHLRLRAGVGLWMQAELAGTKPGENRGKSVADLEGQVIPLGGESRTARVMRSAATLDIPKPAKPTKLVKWVLATHAVFVGGWRPGWVDVDTGRVRLKTGETIRRADENREQHRIRLSSLPEIGAKLVAVRCEKPIHFSGWDLGEGGPKPTYLAVPAGSVYYFEADDEAQGAALVGALHDRTRSDFLGEKGLGLGYCGVWPDIPGRPAV
jgi:CRISPR type III-B/RAMP module-associated protein Cmr3